MENKNQNLLNKDKAIHYSSLGVDLAETIARALTRIILIEDTNTSIKVRSKSQFRNNEIAIIFYQISLYSGSLSFIQFIKYQPMFQVVLSSCLL